VAQHIRVTLSARGINELHRRAALTGRNIAIEATLALEAALRGVEARPYDTLVAIERRANSASRR